MNSQVLILGLDPYSVPSIDPAPIATALADAEKRFHGTELDAQTVLLPLTEGAEQLAADAIGRAAWGCVVIGGGIRKPEELLEFFETIVNLVRALAPNASIAFNSTGIDSLEAAQRVLEPAPHSDT